MSVALYTDTHGAREASELGGMELRNMIAGGADAVKKAATTKNPPEYFLDVDYHNYGEIKRLLRVRVRPSVLGGSTAVHADVLGADFELAVTAVYDALAATPKASRLDLGSLVEGEYAAVNRLINARSSTGEVGLFVSGSGRLTVFAVLAVIRALSDLGVGGERTLVIHDTGLGLGSELYSSSTVRIGTVGDALIAPSIDRADRERVRTLFEGGEWAFQKEAEDAHEHSIRLEGTPELRIALNVRTQWLNIADRSRTAPHVFVRGDSTDLKLLVISNTWDVVDVLRVTHDWDITQALRAKYLMNEYEKARGMTILAWATKEDTDVRASSWRSAVSRVLRTLYDLKLTAREANTDALVIVRDGEGKQEASRLLSWINVTAGVARVMQRERRIPTSDSKKLKHEPAKDEEFRIDVETDTSREASEVTARCVYTGRDDNFLRYLDELRLNPESLAFLSIRFFDTQQQYREHTEWKYRGKILRFWNSLKLHEDRLARGRRGFPVLEKLRGIGRGMLLSCICRALDEGRIDLSSNMVLEATGMGGVHPHESTRELVSYYEGIGFTRMFPARYESDIKRISVPMVAKVEDIISAVDIASLSPAIIEVSQRCKELGSAA